MSGSEGEFKKSSLMNSVQGSSAIRALSVVVFFCLVSVAQSVAQTQASCTFNVFQLSDLQTTVFGVNDSKTVVGEADFASTPSEKGFIRYSGGRVSYYSAPSSAATRFTGRNDAGISIGVYSSLSASTIAKGFMLSGSTFTSIVHSNAVWGTTLTGINKYNSIVGWYLDSNENPHGFKRYSNGSFRILQFNSGTIDTIPNGINDFGTIVGWYNTAHGFIFHNNAWATLDYPNNSPTELKGISNSGIIVGINHSNQQGVSFLYANGKFKIINIPNSFLTNVASISPGGLIAGTANMTGDQTGWRGFTATCN
jgi:hypothetical protein